MNSIYRKSRVIKTYSLILIELLGVAVAYMLALFFRFGTFLVEDNKEVHWNYGLFLLGMSLLYSIMTDWNRDFFERGYFMVGFWILWCDGTCYGVYITFVI